MRNTPSTGPKKVIMKTYVYSILYNGYKTKASTQSTEKQTSHCRSHLGKFHTLVVNT